MPLAKIKVIGLEVFYRVGVTETERAQPQRLLLDIEMVCDIRAAARSDRCRGFRYRVAKLWS